MEASHLYRRIQGTCPCHEGWKLWGSTAQDHIPQLHLEHSQEGCCPLGWLCFPSRLTVSLEVPSAMDPTHTGPESSFPHSANIDKYL